MDVPKEESQDQNTAFDAVLELINAHGNEEELKNIRTEQQQVQNSGDAAVKKQELKPPRKQSNPIDYD